MPGSVPDSPAPATSAPVQVPLLPPGLIWVYVIAPIGLAVLMSHDLTAASGSELLRKVGSQYVPFIAYGLAFHLVYRYLVPAPLARLRSTSARVALHLATVVAVPLVVAFAAHPALEWTAGVQIPFRSFVLTSVVVSAACVLPALLVQRLRVRAMSAERAAMAERQAAVQAQLDALQARTDPHFLFNSLNTVAALIPEDPEKAERTLESLAELFRYALDSSRQRAVPLAREVEMVSEYLSLQAARFGERLQAHVEVDVDLAHVQVPPLLLQPLVENAILHGAAGRKGGEVRVVVRREQQTLVVEVTDNGPGLGASCHTGSGSAIAGVSERIRLHYAGRGEIVLRQRSEGGCLARMVLPLGEAL